MPIPVPDVSMTSPGRRNRPIINSSRKARTRGGRAKGRVAVARCRCASASSQEARVDRGGGGIFVSSLPHAHRRCERFSSSTSVRIIVVVFILAAHVCSERYRSEIASRRRRSRGATPHPFSWCFRVGHRAQFGYCGSRLHGSFLGLRTPGPQATAGTIWIRGSGWWERTGRDTRKLDARRKRIARPSAQTRATL